MLQICVIWSNRLLHVVVNVAGVYAENPNVTLVLFKSALKVLQEIKEAHGSNEQL